MAEKRLDVRLQSIGGKTLRKEFRSIGKEGSRSFAMVDREVANLNRRLGRLGKTSGSGGFALRNMGLQLSQVAQQGAVTGDYMRALSIQMPDLLLGFGGLGIAIGSAAAVLAPFALSLLESANGSEKLSERIDELNSAVKEYKAGVKAAASPTSELIKEYGSLAGKARELLEAEKQLAKMKALGAISAAITSASDAVGDLGSNTARELETATRKMADIGMEIGRLRAEQRALVSEGLGIPQNAARNIEIMTRLSELQNSLRGLGGMIEPLREMAENFGISTFEALRLAKAVEDVRNAKGIEEQAEALERMRITFIDTIGGIENMNEEQRALLERITESSIATMSFRAAAGEAADETARAADEGENLSAALGGASGAADDLVARMFDVVKDLEKARRIASEIERMGARGGGRGGDPRKRGGSFADWKVYSEFGWHDPSDIKLPGGRPRSGSSGSLKTAVDQDRKAFERLKASIDAAFAAEIKMKEAEMTLDKAVRAGIVGKHEAAEMLKRVKENLDATSAGARQFEAMVSASMLDAITGARSLGDVFDTLAEKIKRAAWEALLFNEGMFARDGGGKGLLGGLLGSLGGALSENIRAGVHHAGGIAGAPATSRMVSAETFLAAPRYHNGGVAGLLPNEVPAILERGERIIPKGVSAGRVEVRVYVDQDGNWRSAVERISGDVAAQVSEKAITSYDRHALPRRVNQINSAPRVVG